MHAQVREAAVLALTHDGALVALPANVRQCVHARLFDCSHLVRWVRDARASNSLLLTPARSCVRACAPMCCAFAQAVVDALASAPTADALWLSAIKDAVRHTDSVVRATALRAAADALGPERLATLREVATCNTRAT